MNKVTYVFTTTVTKCEEPNVAADPKVDITEIMETDPTVVREVAVVTAHTVVTDALEKKGVIENFMMH